MRAPKNIILGTALSFLMMALFTSQAAMAAPPHRSVTTTTTTTTTESYRHGRVVETTTTTTEVRGKKVGHYKKNKHAKKARRGHRHDHVAPVYHHPPRQAHHVQTVYHETRPMPVRTVHSGPKVVFPSQVVVNLPRIGR